MLSVSTVTCLLFLIPFSVVTGTVSYVLGPVLPSRHVSTCLLLLLVQQNKALTSQIADSGFESSCKIYGQC